MSLLTELEFVWFWFLQRCRAYGACETAGKLRAKMNRGAYTVGDVNQFLKQQNIPMRI